MFWWNRWILCISYLDTFFKKITGVIVKGMEVFMILDMIHKARSLMRAGRGFCTWKVWNIQWMSKNLGLILAAFTKKCIRYLRLNLIWFKQSGKVRGRYHPGKILAFHQVNSLEAKMTSSLCPHFFRINMFIWGRKEMKAFSLPTQQLEKARCKLWPTRGALFLSSPTTILSQFLHLTFHPNTFPHSTPIKNPAPKIAMMNG